MAKTWSVGHEMSVAVEIYEGIKLERRGGTHGQGVWRSILNAYVFYPGHQEEFSPTCLLETHHVRAMTWSHVHLEGQLRWHVIVCSDERRGFCYPVIEYVLETWR